MNLKAETFRYDEVTGQVFAEGSVEVEVEDFVIKADRIFVDAATGVATAEGNIFVEKEDYTARGESLTFDSSSESASLKNFYTVYSPERLQGKIYMRIEEFVDSKEDRYGLNASATTCDYDAPHYHIIARRFEYYPGDKMVFFFVTLYAGKVPVFWMPYLIYDLKDRRSSFSVSIGTNRVEGDFIKTAFDYFISNDHYGLIFIDMMSRKGLGKGFKHAYRLDPFNAGTFLLYNVEERDTGLNSWALNLNHGVALSPDTALSLTHDLKDIYRIAPLGRYDQTRTNISLRHSSERSILSSLDIDDNRQGGIEKYQFKLSHGIEKFRSDFFLKIDRSKLLPRWKNISANFSHSQPFIVDDQTLSVKAHYLSRQTDEGFAADERLDPEIVFTKRTDMYTLRGTYSFYLDLDGSRYLGDDRVEFVKKEPEIWVGFRPQDLGLFTLSTNIEYGRYRERKYIASIGQMRDYTTGRHKVGVNASRSMPVGFGSTLNLSGSLDQYVYDPGDSRYVLTDRVGLSTNLWGFFRNSLNFEAGYSSGGTPFYFDTVGVNKNLLTETMTLYYLDIVNWTTTSGYNFLTKKYLDIMSTLRYTPDQRLSVTLRGGFDIEAQRYKDLSTRTVLKPWPKVIAEIDSVHDINNSILKSAGVRFDVEVGETWEQKVHVRSYSRYDYFTGRFELRDLSIVKDLHCWQAMLTYSAWRREHVFTMMLKAFPSAPFGWASGERGFFVEGFDSGMIYQPSPARY